MKTKLIFLLLLFAHLTLFAQKGSVRGFVYDKENGEPIMFCNVIIEGKSIGASTDVNGFFNITNVPTGNHTLFVTYIGYDTLRQDITLKDKQILNRKLEISPSSVKIETVTVSADRQEMKTEVKVSVTKITPKDIKLIPAGINLISFGVILVTDTFTSVFISCLSADTVTVSIFTDEGEISNFRLSICLSFSVMS